VTTLERIGAEILGGVFALAAVLLWWHVHNLDEQKAGAQACIQSTTVTKQTAVADNVVDTTAQAAQLRAVVQTYDQKISDLSSGNADLAQRLHDNAVRPSAVPHSGPAAAGAQCPVAVPAGQSDARAAAPLEQAEAKLFDDCDADYAGRLAVIQAYNDWRDRMIAAQK
jgi:hypothetical protein